MASPLLELAAAPPASQRGGLLRQREGRIHEAAAALASLLAVAIAALALWWHRAGTAPPVLPWLFASGIGVAAAGMWWTLLRQRSVEAQARDARLEAHALADLLDAWHWRTDAAHRLTLLRPPRRASQVALAVTAGDALWEVFGADPDAAARLRAAIESRGAFDGLRACHRTGDGASLPFELQAVAAVDSLGRFAGHVGTARPRAEDDALRDDRRVLEALLDTLSTPVFLLAERTRRTADGADGADSVSRNVVRCNAAARGMLGLPQATPLPLDWDALLPQLPAPLAEALQREPEAPGEATAAGWRLLARRVEPAPPTTPSDVRITLIVLLPQAGADGDPQPAPVSSAAPPADDAERESFGYTVSHDLRAPLRVVDGFARILKEDYGAQLDRVGNDHLDRVLGAAARMNGMIDALLALSRLSSRPLLRQPVDLSQLAGYVVEDLKRQSPGREAEVHIDAGLKAEGDPTLLRIVLENLLGNAWKYSAKVEHPHIRFEGSVQDGRTVYTVRDNGAGFDMRFADRLFGVFQRLHSASDFQGTGIGLASVRRIVRRHGGEIWAESEVGNGASFHFTLSGAGR